MEEKPKSESRALTIPRQGWRAFRTEKELNDIILEYFEWELGRARCPQMYGVAVYVGVSYHTLREYAKGVYDDVLNRYSAVLQQAADRIIYEKAAGAIDGRWNGAFVKFDLSVNHDWVDKKSIDVTSNGETLTAADVTPKLIDPALSADDALRSYQEFCRKVKDLVPQEAPVKT